MRYFFIVLVAMVASLSGFFVHVISVEWLPNWVANQMQDFTIKSSWDVRYIAALSAIEYGLAAVGLYLLSRPRLIKVGILNAALIFSVLLASIHGAFIRQPVMDYIIGNPIHVVIVQNAFQWLIWLLWWFMVLKLCTGLFLRKINLNQIEP